MIHIKSFSFVTYTHKFLLSSVGEIMGSKEKITGIENQRGPKQGIGRCHLYSFSANHKYLVDERTAHLVFLAQECWSYCAPCFYKDAGL